MQGLLRSVVVAFTFAACNAAMPSDPGDLDGDGIKDDPCIAPASDATGDFDADGVANADDPCSQFDRNGGDNDGDGIPDACDPFPMVAGDRHRCTMVFSDPAVDAALWSTRLGFTGFAYNQEGSAPTLASSAWYGGNHSEDSSFVVATETLEAPETTTYYDVTIVFGASATSYGFALYVRADPSAPSDSDVACVLTGSPGLYNNGTWQLTIVKGSTIIASTPLVGSASGQFWGRMRAVIEPGSAGASVRCDASGFVVFGAEQMAGLAVGPLTAAVDLPPGNVGFATQGASAEIRLLAISDRDDAPSL